MEIDREKRRCPKNGWGDQSQKKTISEADESQIKRIRKNHFANRDVWIYMFMFTPKIGEDYITI